MIFVTLGTQDKTFERLLKAVEKQITMGNIQEEVIVQAGQTQFTSSYMKLYDFVDETQMNAWITECRVLITHGGVGTIISALLKHKKIIAAARLAKYGEHANDHQLQIIENFSEEGYILPLENFDELDSILLKTNSFIPKSFESNTAQMVDLIRKQIAK